jgi:hypothetical protein
MVTAAKRAADKPHRIALPNSQRLQSAGNQSYGYDANGNTTQAGAASYVYNPLNQLKQANLGGSPVAQYGYDGLRQRGKAQ